MDEIIAERIRSRRLYLRISKSELVRRMRRRGHITLHRQGLTAIENSARKVTAPELRDLARELQAPPWWLLGMSYEEAAAIDADFLKNRT